MMTTSNAAGDDKIGIITTLGFQIIVNVSFHQYD